MGICLLEKLFQQVAKDTADERFCAKQDDAINTVFECEMSSNNINEFNDCLIKSVITLFGQLNKSPKSPKNLN